MGQNLLMLFSPLDLAMVPGAVFWPYFGGTVVLLIGIFATRSEVIAAHGPEKVVSLGPVFYAVPLAVFGAQHFTEAKAISQMVPEWMPIRLLWTYLVGIALFAAALSIVVKKEGLLSGTLLAVMLALFVVLLHVPRVMAKPSDRISWAVALRDLAFSGGALAFAGTQIEEWRTKGTNPRITFGRIVIAAAAIFFGVEQLLHPDFVPGVPLEKPTPTWIPGHIAWGYLAGAVSLVAGVGLIANRKSRLAATCLGAMVLLLMIFVYAPMLAASLSDIDNGLDFFADTLMFSGAVLLLAEAMPREVQGHV